MKLHLWLTPLVFVFAAFVLFVPSPSRGQASAAKPIAAPPMEEFVGEITSIRKVALAMKVAGRLQEVQYFPGDILRKGEIMAKLESQDFELSVKQAEATIEVTRARLRQQEVGSRPEEKKQAEEQLRQAKANMENARAEYQRSKDLFASGAVSKQMLDTAEARFTVAEAQYMGAKQQKAVVDQGPRIEEKEGTRALIRQQEASMEMARLQLQYSSLVAPFDGMVAMRQMDEGAYVTPSMPIYTFIQIDPVYAVIDIPERLVPLLRPGVKAEIRVDALSGQVFLGVLHRVPAFIDSKTRTAKAEFEVENTQKTLRPGMFARAFISLPAEKETQK